MGENFSFTITLKITIHILQSCFFLNIWHKLKDWDNCKHFFYNCVKCKTKSNKKVRGFYFKISWIFKPEWKSNFVGGKLLKFRSSINLPSGLMWGPSIFLWLPNCFRFSPFLTYSVRNGPNPGLEYNVPWNSKTVSFYFLNHLLKHKLN